MIVIYISNYILQIINFNLLCSLHFYILGVLLLGPNNRGKPKSDVRRITVELGCMIISSGIIEGSRC